MNVVRFDESIPFESTSVVTVGTFDGVHCGHRGIIQRMRAEADRRDGRVVVVTFDPHPQIVLAKPDREPLRLLTTIEDRCALLAGEGVDLVVVIPFDKTFAARSAEEFVRDLYTRIGITSIFIGHDHHFGKDRRGNVDLLRVLGSELHFDVQTVEPLACDDVIVSSTKIRRALADGDLVSAEAMLGRPYSVTGTVVHGDKRGRELGIPTANIRPLASSILLPANGIYVAESVIDGTTVHGMASIGLRPMFTNDVEPTLEVHYLDFSGDLYDRQLTVTFRARIRAEEHYPDIATLLAQIENDRVVTRQFFDVHSTPTTNNNSIT
ncbi:MAG TPA: bifunctional riboflavin kinase/FMN adenylyltransferase [Bacteroidetes bacterium]|nr:bifunctional riboflavin kinase/FMN adenylyltransferase [Bacteroidota bacterium]HRK04923.1 bifunctional riboflavin kinase/FAD synthetase [Chlorobiota bacterium]